MVGGEDGARFGSRRVDPKRKPRNSGLFLCCASQRESRPVLRNVAIEQRRCLVAGAGATKADDKCSVPEIAGILPEVSRLFFKARSEPDLAVKRPYVSHTGRASNPEKQPKDAQPGGLR